MSVPTPSFDGTFIVTPATNVGYISITDTVDWASCGIDPADVSIFLTIIDPTGAPWHPENLSLPDISPNFSTNFQQRLQSTLTGAPMAGEYLVTYKAVVGGGVNPGTYTLGPVTVTLCADAPTVCLDAPIDCLYMYGQVIDNTPWGTNGFTLVSRTMTLNWPRGISGGGPAPVTTSGASIDIPVGQLYNGTYTAVADYVLSQGATTYNIHYVKEFAPTCVQSGQDLCSMICCLESAAQRVGRQNSDLQPMSAENFNKMVGLFIMAQGQASCGHGVKLEKTLADFYSLGKCTDCRDCGCGGTGPSLLVPIHPGGGGGSVAFPNFIGGSGITCDFDSGTNQWTITCTYGHLISQLYNTICISSDYSIQWGVGSPVGNPPTYTYDAKVKVPSPRTMIWREIWNPSANARAVVGGYPGGYNMNPEVGNPALGKNVFDPLNIIGSAYPSPFNNLWKVEDFFWHGAVVDYQVDVKVVGYTPASGNAITLTFGELLKAVVVEKGADYFVMALVQAAGTGSVGSKLPLNAVLWISLFDDITLEFTLSEVRS